MVRTISEILKEADLATELSQLVTLWNEIAEKKWQYPLVELWFANQHIRGLSLFVEGTDFEIDSFYTRLKKMDKS